MTPKEQAQEGLSLLRRSILKTIKNNPGGINNADIAKELCIQSDYQGSQKNYLSWSILGLLLNEGKVRRSGRLYFSNHG